MGWKVIQARVRLMAAQLLGQFSRSLCCQAPGCLLNHCPASGLRNKQLPHADTVFSRRWTAGLRSDTSSLIPSTHSALLHGLRYTPTPSCYATTQACAPTPPSSSTLYPATPHTMRQRWSAMVRMPSALTLPLRRLASGASAHGRSRWSSLARWAAGHKDLGTRAQGSTWDL